MIENSYLTHSFQVSYYLSHFHGHNIHLFPSKCLILSLSYSFTHFPLSVTYPLILFHPSRYVQSPFKSILLSLCYTHSHKHSQSYSPTGNSVTIFGEILPLWQNVKSLWAIFKVIFKYVCGKFCNLVWKCFYAIGQVNIVTNGQIVKNNLAIWSH